MRKHVEDTAALPRKYWNLLFELAILLMPFGGLVAYWGAPWLGLGLQIVGLLMLPPLWVARHKLFGMSKEDMTNSILGWGLFVGATVMDVLSGNPVISLIAAVLRIIGILKIWTHGVYLERSTRFWLVIFLYLGIPAYIFGSSFLGQLDNAGAFVKNQPFGHRYCIVSAEQGEVPGDLTMIEVDHRGALYLGSERIWGKFEYVKPANYQQDTLRGTWYLAPEKGPTDSETIPGALYRLEATSDERMLLSYLENEQLQWRWELKQIPGMWFAVNTSGSAIVWEMDWFSAGTFTGDPATVGYTSTSVDGTAFLECHDMVGQEPEELTVIEEYHHGDQVEYREFVLFKDKNDNYPLPDDIPEKRYEDADQYILYRVQWEGGEFLFRLQFQ